ncbi:hypothetical protein DRE_01796 [Drechslerella stenobrocha 248]|uniref:Uncharacterized protein n=1 Tax=Drechslerella stenobrocha 248 TaxID=1043628 RepID=W7HYJ6_9PEZI|nr:hypothetical protein DRE_01796 [Drechslerella stenobrocha 248]
MPCSATALPPLQTGPPERWLVSRRRIKFLAEWYNYSRDLPEECKARRWMHLERHGFFDFQTRQLALYMTPTALSLARPTRQYNLDPVVIRLLPADIRPAESESDPSRDISTSPHQRPPTST